MLSKRAAKKKASNSQGFGGGGSDSGLDARDTDTGSEDLSPAPPGLSTVPDEATLRAEFAKRGIVPPSTSKPTSSREEDVNVDYADSAQTSTMPEVVAARMGRRMMIFGGIPISLLFAFFAAYFVLTFRFEIRVIPAVVAYSTLLLIGGAGLGITYGIFSSSWDPEDAGSRLGFDEAQVNFFRVRDALAGQSRREKKEEEFEEFDRIADKQPTDEE